MTYQMLMGKVPFKGQKNEIYDQIIGNKISWLHDDGSEMEHLPRHFITSLLKIGSQERPSWPQIFAHPFLSAIDFTKTPEEVL